METATLHNNHELRISLTIYVKIGILRVRHMTQNGQTHHKTDRFRRNFDWRMDVNWNGDLTMLSDGNMLYTPTGNGGPFQTYRFMSPWSKRLQNYRW